MPSKSGEQLFVFRHFYILSFSTSTQLKSRKVRTMSETENEESKKTQYVSKPKTPEQAKGWEDFKVAVAAATTGAMVLDAAIRYEVADKAQAAFAFNRAKKLLLGLGVLQGEKWKKGFGNMGKIKLELFDAFRRLDTTYVELLKRNIITPSSSGEKRKTLIPQAPAPVVHVPITSAPATAPVSKKRPRESDAVAQAPSATTTAPASGSRKTTSASAGNVSAATLESETIRSMRCQRLQEAINHPSFAMLTKTQQSLVRQEYMVALTAISQV
jgi:hypothetical protein